MFDMPNLVENCRMSLGKYASEIVRDSIAKIQIENSAGPDASCQLPVARRGWTMRQIGQQAVPPALELPFRQPPPAAHTVAFFIFLSRLLKFKKQITHLRASTPVRKTNFRHVLRFGSEVHGVSKDNTQSNIYRKGESKREREGESV